MSEDSSHEITNILRKQNEKMDYHSKQMEYLIWHVMGNKDLKIKGINPTLEDMQKELAEVKAWKDGLWKLDLKNLVTRQTINTISKIFIWAVGLGSGTFGVFSLLKTLVYGGH